MHHQRVTQTSARGMTSSTTQYVHIGDSPQQSAQPQIGEAGSKSDKNDTMKSTDKSSNHND